MCRACQKKYDLENWRSSPRRQAAKRKRTADIRAEVRAYVAALLCASVCADCPERDPVVLDFHHRDRRSKRAAVARLISDGHSLKTVAAEIKKCVILCANCHRRREARVRLTLVSQRIA